MRGGGGGGGGGTFLANLVGTPQQIDNYEEEIRRAVLAGDEATAFRLVRGGGGEEDEEVEERGGGEQRYRYAWPSVRNEAIATADLRRVGLILCGRVMGW